MSAAEEVVIQLTGIQTRFGEHVVHRDLELSVLRGEVLCIV
jgi:phospholipid/cholesterol/gamma-HCH transport system ATP-binding protein